MRVTDTRHCTESEKININLQVVNYRSLELESLNYEEVFFVELKWILWNSTVWPKNNSSPPPSLWIHKKYYLPYPLGFLDPSVLCKLSNTQSVIAPNASFVENVQCNTRRNTHFCCRFGTYDISVLISSVFYL